MYWKKFPAFGVGKMLPVKLTSVIFRVLFSLNFTRCATQKQPMKSMALAFVDTIQYLVPWHKYLLNNNNNNKRKKKKRRKVLMIFSCIYVTGHSNKSTKDCTVSIVKHCNGQDCHILGCGTVLSCSHNFRGIYCPIFGIFSCFPSIGVIFSHF